MFKIDNSDVAEFESHLKTFGHRAYPFATKATLNRSAFKAQELARKDVRAKMVTRNQFTERSIQVDQARTLNVSRQSATVGSIAPYMEDQEFGATKHKTGSEGVSIPTGYSAGQEGQQPRTRLSRKPNRLASIKLQRRSKKGKNRRQRNLIAIKGAAASGNKYVFLDLGRKKGIFKVTGGKRRPKLKMVHDMTEQSVTIPRNPTIKPAADATQVMMPNFYKEALWFQLNRLNLFR